jgi:hypothetical protein
MAPPAVAGHAAPVPEVAIPCGDLKLSSPGDAAVMLQRIRRARHVGMPGRPADDRFGYRHD